MKQQKKRMLGIFSLLAITFSQAGVAATPLKKQTDEKQAEVTQTKASEMSTKETYSLANPSNAVTANEEKWKSLRDPDGYTLGALTGLGSIGSKKGIAFLGAAAVNINQEGWLDDISDSVLFEVEAGPYFYSGNAQLLFSTHLKWDFRYDPHWTFYALAGIGGDYTDKQFEDGITLYPRVGLGAVYHLSMDVAIRAEISHEFTGVGASFHF